VCVVALWLPCVYLPPRSRLREPLEAHPPRTAHESGVTVVSYSCDSGVTVVLQQCHNGVAVVLQKCHSGVTVVS
jgi:hypothetical protein